MTSHNLWSRYLRHFVGINNNNNNNNKQICIAPQGRNFRGDMLLGIMCGVNDSRVLTFLRVLPTRWRRKPAGIAIDM